MQQFHEYWNGVFGHEEKNYEEKSEIHQEQPWQEATCLRFRLQGRNNQGPWGCFLRLLRQGIQEDEAITLHSLFLFIIYIRKNHIEVKRFLDIR